MLLLAAQFAYAQQTPKPFIASVANGASFVPNHVSVASIATIKGSNFSPCTEGYRYPVIPTSMCNGGVSVRISGKEAPLFYTGHELKDSNGAIFDQINFLVPADTPQGMAKVEVVNGTNSAAASVYLRDSAPGVFEVPRFEMVKGARTHGGFAALQRWDPNPYLYQLTDLHMPAKQGDYILVWATGLGPTVKEEGGVRYLRTPDLYINGRAVEEVLQAVESPQFKGLHQFAFKVPKLSTGIYGLTACYDSGTNCSKQVEFPVAGGDAWAGGWLEDLKGKPLSGIPVAVNGDVKSNSAASGAFMAPVQAGRQNEVKVRGMSAEPKRYNFTDVITPASGATFLRAVDARNEREISGTIQMIRYTIDPSVRMVYVPNFSIQRTPTNALDFWKPGGNGVDYLDFLKYMNGDQAVYDRCGFGKTMRLPDDSYPIPVFLDELKAPAGFIERIRPAVTTWKDSDGTRRFVEVREDPTEKARGIRFDYSQMINWYEPKGQTWCMGPLYGIVSINYGYADNLTLYSNRIPYATWHELGHGQQLGNYVHSFSVNDTMSVNSNLPPPSQREQTVAEWLKDLRNGTLTDKHGRD